MPIALKTLSQMTLSREDIKMTLIHVSHFLMWPITTKLNGKFQLNLCIITLRSEEYVHFVGTLVSQVCDYNKIKINALKANQGSYGHWKTWKMLKKNSRYGKIMEFYNLGKVIEKSWNFISKARENFKWPFC